MSAQRSGMNNIRYSSFSYILLSFCALSRELVASLTVGLVYENIFASMPPQIVPLPLLIASSTPRLDINEDLAGYGIPTLYSWLVLR